MVLLRCISFLVLCSLQSLALPGQSQWQVKAGASYVRCGDPLGAGHGSYTGRSVDGMGYHVGAALEPVTERVLGLRGELLIDVRSTGYTFNESTVPYGGIQGAKVLERGDRRMRTVQLEMPVLLAIRKWPLLRFDTGVGIGYLVSAEERMVGYRNDQGNEEPVDEREDRTGQLARWEAALVLGAEVDSGHRLSMGLRLWKGLTNLDRAEGAAISTATMWQLSMAYTLHDARSAL